MQKDVFGEGMEVIFDLEEFYLKHTLLLQQFCSNVYGEPELLPLKCYYIYDIPIRVANSNDRTSMLDI